MAGILIFGSGSHAKALLENALHSFGDAAFIAHNETYGEMLGCHIYPRSAIERLHGQYAFAIAAVGDNALRAERFGELLYAGFEPAVLIHPTAYVSRFAYIGGGSAVLAGATVNACARIGRNCIINTGAIVEHDCVIGANTHISPGAVLGGGVHIGRGSWVCMGALIAPRADIGEHCVIGAGSIVLSDVAPHTRVHGLIKP